MAKKARDTTFFRRHVGGRIKEQRKAKGWTEDELGKRVDLSQSSIGNIEAGRQLVQIDTLYRMSVHFDCSINDLIPTKNDFLISIIQEN